MADLIIIAVLAAAVVLVIRYQKKQKAAGESGCGGSCAGCSGCRRDCGSKAMEIAEDVEAVKAAGIAEMKSRTDKRK